MSLADHLWRSPLPAPAWQALAAAAGVVWALPAAIGAALLGLAWLLGDAGGLGLWAIGLALMFSPALSWAGWVLALPAAGWLAGRGRFGWGQAALVGIVAGAIAGKLVDSGLALPFGLVSLLAFRAVLARGRSGP